MFVCIEILSLGGSLLSNISRILRHYNRLKDRLIQSGSLSSLVIFQRIVRRTIKLIIIA